MTATSPYGPKDRVPALALRVAVVVVAVLVVVLGATLGIVTLTKKSGSIPAASGHTSTTTHAAHTTTTAVPPPSNSPPNHLVAVSGAGALVVLNPLSGAVVRTLVPHGVVGDSVAISPNDKTVYFDVASGCYNEVESIPWSGGKTANVAIGSLPVINSAGTELAFAHQPILAKQGCVPLESSSVETDWFVVVRQLPSGHDSTLHIDPTLAKNGLPEPISHISWSADSSKLLVTVASAEDNEGWSLNVIDLATDHYYAGPNVPRVPVTGSGANTTYYYEGIFLPNNDLFVVNQCCQGLAPERYVHLQVITVSGTLVKQIAVGFLNRAHTSLDSDPSGTWVLYLAAADLYVTHNGADPVSLATGYAAAAWR